MAIKNLVTSGLYAVNFMVTDGLGSYVGTSQDHDGSDPTRTKKRRRKLSHTPVVIWQEKEKFTLDEPAKPTEKRRKTKHVSVQQTYAEGVRDVQRLSALMKTRAEKNPFQSVIDEEDELLMAGIL